MHIEEFLDKNIYADYEKFNFLAGEAFIIDLNFLFTPFYISNTDLI